jgi:ABC-type oligopeptide transport system substrate-binding subunit
VARVQGLGERLLLRRLSQELERRHHLVQALGEVRVDGYFLSRYRFTHTLFQQYLYSNFSPGERRLLHGEVAKALEDFYQGEGDDVSVQLARHYAEAGQTAQAVDYLLRAGDRARNLFAHQEAVEFYQRALGFLKEQGAHERTARTLMKLGLTYHMAFDFTRARVAYQEGFVLWQRAGADQPAAGPPAPHPLRLAWFDPPTLDPALCGDDNSGFLIHQLFSGLVTLNADMDVVPEVARTWDVLDGGQRYLFHLREDARWSDGRPLTADDFVFAWRRVLDPAVASPNASYLFDVVGGRDYYEGRLHDPEQIGLRALDERTLLVELIGPVSSFPHRLTLAGLYPVPRHALEAHGPAWTAPDKLVANGAFRLESWQPGQAMRLARSPSYRGPFTGNVMRVELVLNLSSAEQMDLYEAGQLDMVSLFSPGEAVRARQRHAGEYFVRPAPFVQYLGFSVSQPPVDDVRVRRALAMAIDKESLAGVVLSGHVFPVTGGFVPPGMPGYSPGISLPYDPAQARALLAEAGYPGGRGFPAVEALVNRPNKAVAAQGITQQWREVLGIEMTWETMEFSDLLERMAQRPPALFYMGWRADYPDPENPLRVGTQRGWTGWQNPVFTDLLERAQRLADPAERLRLYQQADRILIEEAPIVPLIQLQYHLLVKPWVSSFPVGPIHWPSWKEVVIEPHP